VTNLIGISGKLQSGKDTVAKIIQWLLLNQDKGTEIPFDKFDLYKEAATWKNVKFADKLKDMVCLLLGCTREQLEDPKFKEKELGEEWWYWKLKVPNYNLDRNEKITLNMMFNTETEAWEYNDKILSYNREVCETVLIKLTPRLLLQLIGTECGRNIIHPNIWINATFADYKPQHFRTVKCQGLFVEHLTTMPNWIISDVRFPNEVKSIKDRGGVLIRIIRPLNDNKIIYNHESETALDHYNDWDYVINNDGTIEDLIEKVKQILITKGLLNETDKDRSF